ncbi:MAG: hypothetical protein NT151_09920 [Acidobacteria bacterium]|nr:hypothetical protein [Acidobacteriota bacterium]
MDTTSLAQRRLELALENEIDAETALHDRSAAVMRDLSSLRAAKAALASARVTLAAAVDAAKSEAA